MNERQKIQKPEDVYQELLNFFKQMKPSKSYLSAPKNNLMQMDNCMI